MIFKILKHDWLSFSRAPFWGQSVAQYILLSLFGLYIIGTLYSIGVFSEEILAEHFPNETALTFTNKYLIYYLFTDLFMRYMFQKYPSLSIKRYLTQNVSKDTLAHYLTTRSLFSFFNIAPFFLFFPFYKKCVSPITTSSQGLRWISMIVLLILITHFISLFVDKMFSKNKLISIGILGVTALFLNLDYKGVLSLSGFTQHIFDFLQQGNLGLILLLVTIVFLYILNYILLRKNVYLDSINISGSNNSISTQSFSFFNSFGKNIGPLMELDAKLIWRNKRTKSFLYASALFIFYPFIFMNNGEFSNNVIMILGSLFAVGGIVLNFGQIMLSMNSSHFDFILSRNIKMRDYFNAKFNFLALSTAALFIITLPYIFINPKMVLFTAMLSLFLVGVVTFAYLYLALNYSNKFEINSGGIFKMQGFSAAHFIIMIPIMAAPVIVYLVFRVFDLRLLGILMIGVLGLLGILSKNYWIQKAEKTFAKKKYKINSNFKK